MLCQCVELNKPKCSQYWPNKVGDSIEHYGLTITCEKVETPDKSFIYTKLSIQRKLLQFHINHSNSKAVLLFLQNIFRQRKEGSRGSPSMDHLARQKCPQDPSGSFQTVTVYSQKEKCVSSN